MRRINGKEDLDDEEILNYYLNKLQEVGGESMAHYQTGIAVVDNKGKTYAITIDETPFLMTTKKSNNDFISGGILDLISYDLECKKYFNELENCKSIFMLNLIKLYEEIRNINKNVELSKCYFHKERLVYNLMDIYVNKYSLNCDINNIFVNANLVYELYDLNTYRINLIKEDKND